MGLSLSIRNFQTFNDKHPRLGVGDTDLGFWLQTSSQEPFALQSNLGCDLLSKIVSDILHLERARLLQRMLTHWFFPLHQPSFQRWEYQERVPLVQSVISTLWIGHMTLLVFAPCLT